MLLVGLHSMVYLSHIAVQQLLPTEKIFRDIPGIGSMSMRLANMRMFSLFLQTVWPWQTSWFSGPDMLYWKPFPFSWGQWSATPIYFPPVVPPFFCDKVVIIREQLWIFLPAYFVPPIFHFMAQQPIFCYRVMVCDGAWSGNANAIPPLYPWFPQRTTKPWWC